ncbi:MAG: hypothetical protein WBC92_01800, partial [Terracidiphilus sp.]
MSRILELLCFRFAGRLCFAFVCGLTAICFTQPAALDAQDASAPPESIDSSAAENNPQAPTRDRVESDLTVEGLVSYGNYRLLASGENCKLYDIGIEYDRHSWGRFLGARRDYVAEILPMVLLNQPTQMD